MHRKPEVPCFEEFLLQPQPELSIRRTGQADHSFGHENDFRFGMACVQLSLFGARGGGGYKQASLVKKQRH